MIAHIILGLGFGDEGKGVTVDEYVRKFGSDLVVRFNGGPQAAHNVSHDGRKHTFSSIGSGTFSGAKTLISSHCLVDPFALIFEARTLDINPKDFIYIDGNCKVITEIHKIANRASASKSGISTCGKGIGMLMQHSLIDLDSVIRVKDLVNKELVIEKLQKTKELFSALYPDATSLNLTSSFKKIANDYVKCYKDLNVLTEEEVIRKINRSNFPVFEGAQGILLDEYYGFNPFNTWSKTHSANAFELLRDYRGEVKKVGVTRTFMTRHGNGPFPTEAVNGSPYPVDKENIYNLWQSHFRTGHFDVEALKYSIRVTKGIDEIALTHYDFVNLVVPKIGANLYKNKIKVCMEYNTDVLRRVPVQGLSMSEREKDTMCMFSAIPLYEHVKGCDFRNFVEEELGHPIKLLSTGPSSKDKIWLE